MEIILSHCNFCGGSRNSSVLHKTEKRWEYEDGQVTGGDVYYMLSCNGCDSVTLRHVLWCSEHEDSDVIIYPPTVARQHPIWFEDFAISVDEDSEAIPRLLNEIYVSLHNNLTLLATMGIRALLERIMIAKVGDNGTFAKNVEKFAEEGFISRRQLALVEAALDAGHAAMHRIYSPSAEDVHGLLDLTESIIASIYLHNTQMEKISKKVPPKTIKKDGPRKVLNKPI